VPGWATSAFGDYQQAIGGTPNAQFPAASGLGTALDFAFQGGSPLQSVLDAAAAGIPVTPGEMIVPETGGTTIVPQNAPASPFADRFSFPGAQQTFDQGIGAPFGGFAPYLAGGIGPQPTSNQVVARDFAALPPSAAEQVAQRFVTPEQTVSPTSQLGVMPPGPGYEPAPVASDRFLAGSQFPMAGQGGVTLDQVRAAVGLEPAPQAGAEQMTPAERIQSGTAPLSEIGIPNQDAPPTWLTGAQMPAAGIQPDTFTQRFGDWATPLLGGAPTQMLPGGVYTGTNITMPPTPAETVAERFPTAAEQFAPYAPPGVDAFAQRFGTPTQTTVPTSQIDVMPPAPIDAFAQRFGGPYAPPTEPVLTADQIDRAAKGDRITIGDALTPQAIGQSLQLRTAQEAAAIGLPPQPGFTGVPQFPGIRGIAQENIPLPTPRPEGAQPPLMQPTPAGPPPSPPPLDVLRTAPYMDPRTGETATPSLTEVPLPTARPPNAPGVTSAVPTDRAPYEQQPTIGPGTIQPATPSEQRAVNAPVATIPTSQGPFSISLEQLANSIKTGGGGGSVMDHFTMGGGAPPPRITNDELVQNLLVCARRGDQICQQQLKLLGIALQQPSPASATMFANR